MHPLGETVGSGLQCVTEPAAGGAEVLFGTEIPAKRQRRFEWRKR